jgi:isoleucyl-tRNA synthetase
MLEQMELARQVASLGLAARNSAGLKVRQPLSRVLAFSGGRRSLEAEFVEIITDELNVKSFEFVEQASQLVRYQVLPDNKLLGPRFGAQFPMLRLALAAADPAAVAANVQAGLPVALEVDGQPVDLKPEEVLVQTHPMEGLAVAADKTATVAVDANLTPELRLEGLAREIVRRVQDFRKQSGLDIADRIQLYLAVSPGLVVLEAHGSYIMSERWRSSFTRLRPLRACR